MTRGLFLGKDSRESMKRDMLNFVIYASFFLCFKKDATTDNNNVINPITIVISVFLSPVVGNFFQSKILLYFWLDYIY